MKVVDNIVYNENMGNAGMLDLYLPEAEQCDGLVIYFHGGGLETGDKIDEKGIYSEWVSRGLTVVSANYRMYPNAKFPDYVDDAAKAVAWCLNHVEEYISYKNVIIGGISAGSYISMLLHFNPDFLAKYGVKEEQIRGYVFDAGQPTVHYKVLQERGADPQAVRIDEAAPLYYVEGDQPENRIQNYLFLIAGDDLVGRREQNELLMRTMETHKYDKNSIDYEIIPGYGHAEYVNVQDSDGKYPYAEKVYNFMKKCLD